MNALRGPVLPTLLAVGIAAASVAGVVALTGTNTKTHHSTAAPATPPPIRNAAWTVDGPHDAESLSTLSGFWIGADVVVRGGVDGLHAMKRTDGTPAWDLPTPGGGNVCGMSATLDSGIGIVVAQATTSSASAGTACNSVSGVDVATGKVLWTTGVSIDFGLPDAGAADYGVASGVAVINSDQSGSDTGVIGLDLHTGTVKWHHASGCGHLAAGFALDGGRVAIAETCQNQSAIHVLDAATGNPVPGAPTPPLGNPPHPQILAASPLAYLDGSSPQSVTFAPGAAAPISDVSTLFGTMTDRGPSRALVADGGGVLCTGGRQATCWTATGSVLSPRGVPNANADHHDVYVVSGPSDAARVITTGVNGHSRASLCRIAADGGVTVEADLSQPVSDYLGKNGIASDYYAFGDAKDLYLVDPHPAGNIEIIDVRLS
jgi:hypothetical protein